MKPRVFFWVQHLLGIGHLRRAATVARHLADGGFDVLLVSGGFTFFADRVQQMLGIDYARSNVLEVMIGRLRRKLDPGGTLNPIETMRGRGYR